MQQVNKNIQSGKPTAVSARATGRSTATRILIVGMEVPISPSVPGAAHLRVVFREMRSSVREPPAHRHHAIVWQQNRADSDFSSGAILLPHDRVMTGSKDGRLYVLDRTNFTKYNADGDKILQILVTPAKPTATVATSMVAPFTIKSRGAPSGSTCGPSRDR